MPVNARSERLRRMAQTLFLFNAGIWLALGAVSLLRLDGGDDQRATALVIAVLMFGNAGAMIVGALGLATRRRLFYWLAVAVVVVNIILTLTDQFGIVDLLTLALDAILLGLLVALKRQAPSPGEL